jgi:hypothetical protein
MAGNDDARRREAEELGLRTSRSAVRLLDVRNVIGGLFTVYGLIITVVRLLDGPDAIKKPRGADHLWLGLALLVLGPLFLPWRALSPPWPPENPEA